MLQLLVAALPAAAALVWARRLAARRPDLALGSSLRRQPWLGLLAAVPVLLVVLEAGARAFPGVEWRLPLWLDRWHTAIAWALLLASMACAFTFAVTVAARRGDAQARKLAIAGALSLVAIELSFLRQTAPIEEELGQSEAAARTDPVALDPVLRLPRGRTRIARGFSDGPGEGRVRDSRSAGRQADDEGGGAQCGLARARRGMQAGLTSPSC